MPLVRSDIVNNPASLWDTSIPIFCDMPHMQKFMPYMNKHLCHDILFMMVGVLYVMPHNLCLQNLLFV